MKYLMFIFLASICLADDVGQRTTMQQRCDFITESLVLAIKPKPEKSTFQKWSDYLHGRKDYVDPDLKWRQAFFNRLQAENDPEVRNCALIIYDDIRTGGAVTEYGAHGHNISWKWLGVGVENGKHTVVGYGNSQNFDYDRKKVSGVKEIAVAVPLMNRVLYVRGRELSQVPKETQERIVKGLELATNFKVRVFQDNEEDELNREGKLP